MKQITRLRGNNKGAVINILVFLLFNHGILYYFNTDNIYNYSNPIKYIKYIIIVILFINVIKLVNKKRLIYVGILCMTIILTHFIATKNLSIILILNYSFPLLVLCLYDPIKSYLNIKKLIISTYIVSAIMAYSEFFLMDKPFHQYADAGYRVCSNFINPNNFAAIIWFITIYLIYYEKSIWNKLIVLVNSCILLILSGSRTGMLVLAIGCYCAAGEKGINILKKDGIVKKRNLMTVMQIIVILCVILFCFRHYITLFMNSLLSSSRQIGELDVSVGRFEQFIEFFKGVQENPIFPSLSRYVYTDNLYLHMWGGMGLAICLAFVLFNIYLFIVCCRCRQKFYSILLILFFLYGLAENYLYLWPMAYIYWYLACIILEERGMKALRLCKA